MKFSIVTPLYNKEAFIGETIQSVLSQTYNDYELIVVDDSSTDNSVSIVNSFSDPRIKLLSKKNGGVSSARNFGIKHSTGDVVCFLDADDLWEKDYLLKLKEIVSNNPQAGFFCCGWKSFIDKKENIVSVSVIDTMKGGETAVVDYFKTSVAKRSSIALTSAVAIKRQVIISNNLAFNEMYSMGEDIDFWVRSALCTMTIYCNEPLMLYRTFAQGSLTLTANSIQQSTEYYKWYSLSNNHYLKQFTTFMLYARAKKEYLMGLYDDSLLLLSKIKGTYLFLHRAYLYLLLRVKKAKKNE